MSITCQAGHSFVGAAWKPSPGWKAGQQHGIDTSLHFDYFHSLAKTAKSGGVVDTFSHFDRTNIKFIFNFALLKSEIVSTTPSLLDVWCKVTI
jgi:hypothetical protein